jgi:hypothetical protein
MRYCPYVTINLRCYYFFIQEVRIGSRVGVLEVLVGGGEGVLVETAASIIVGNNFGEFVGTGVVVGIDVCVGCPIVMCVRGVDSEVGDFP